MSRFKVIRPREAIPVTELWSEDSQWIAGDTIVDSTWTVGPEGPELGGKEFSDAEASVLISSALFGTQYTLINIVTTSSDKVREKSWQIRCTSGPPDINISPYAPSLDFSDARNSMYIALLEDI